MPCQAFDERSHRSGVRPWQPWRAWWPMGLLLAGLLGCAAGAARAEEAEALPAKLSPSGRGTPYYAEIWAVGLFDEQGRLQQLDVPDAAQQPAAFVERVRQYFAQAQVPPVRDSQGAPARFQTGLGLYLRVTPGEALGTVEVLQTVVAPRPIKRYLAKPPRSSGERIEALVRCTIDTDGLCDKASIVQATAGSETVRRWGRASLEGWVYEPQRINDQPVPSEVLQWLAVRYVHSQPPEFRHYRHP